MHLPFLAELARHDKLHSPVRTRSFKQTNSPGWLSVTIEIDLQETRTASTYALLKVLSVVLIQIFPSDRACARIFPCHFFTQAGRIYASVVQLSGCDNLNEEEQVGIRRASHYKPRSHLDQSLPSSCARHASLRDSIHSTPVCRCRGLRNHKSVE